MLSLLARFLADPLVPLTQGPAAPRAEASEEDDLARRAAQAAREVAALPFEPRGTRAPQRWLLAMGALDLVTREADQHPDTAGRTPNYAPYPAFAPVEIPGHGGVVLKGHHSVGAPGAPAVFVIHGLNDSHVTHYVVEHAEVLRRWGFHVFALDMRDHGMLRGRGPPTSMGLHEGRDLFAAARTVADREGVSVGLLGFSLGGQCAVRAAHEATLAGRADVLRGGVASVCGPLNVHEAVAGLDDATRLPRGRGWIDRMIMRELIRTLHRHLRLHVGEHLADRPPTGTGRIEDHEAYIKRCVLPAYPDDPPLVGAFLGAARSTRKDVLGKLEVPTLILHAEDDPLVPVLHAHQAREAAGDNPWVTVRTVPRGGHGALGYEDPAGYLALLGTWFGRLADG